jgi:integrase
LAKTGRKKASGSPLLSTFFGWSTVLGLESWGFTTEKILEVSVSYCSETAMFGYPHVWTQQKQDTKPSRRETRLLWPGVKRQLESIASWLPKLKLIKANAIFWEARKRRFSERSKTPKYGSMNKGFTDEELERFFRFVDNAKYRLLFSFQAVLGLRVGEAVRIHIKDLNLKTKELRIDTEKGKRTDYLPIPETLFNETLNFITQNEQEIARCKGYVFWADYYPERNDIPHASSNYARNVFVEVINKAKLDETYAIAEGKTPKLLHRLTTHSLRHYAITNHARKNNGNVVLASRFARHRDLETTMTYVHTGKEEFYKSIMNAQEDSILDKVRKMQENV